MLAFSDLIKKINKNITLSFVVIVVFFVSIISGIIVYYKNTQEKIVSKKLAASFSVIVYDISQKLVDITLVETFHEYIFSGRVSRAHNYTALLMQICNKNLGIIIGMEIFDREGINIFSYGQKTDNSITVPLCFLNRRYLNFDAGNCLFTWKIYFKNGALVEELKRFNPELEECDNCSKSLITDSQFGDFPLLQFTGMKVNLGIKKDPFLLLLWVMIFAACLLLALVMWNINRIKGIFKKYLSDPLVEITNKIKNDESMPLMSVAELSYLTSQIDLWKKQLIEFEKAKASEKTKEDKTTAMQLLGASIAHELRTPLQSINAGVHGIEKILPVLLKGYDTANNAHLLTEVISPQQFRLSKNVLHNLKIELASANTMIDMLLMRIKGSITQISGIERLSMSECLSEAIRRYACQEEEKKLIVCDTKNDFYFDGDRILVIHIIFNLLKNALYYIAKAKKGGISIHFENGIKNTVHFKDTGLGIASDVLPGIFERFFSRTPGGVGIGLSFCKMAMEWMNGEIVCQSIEGEYTEFVLYFPQPERKLV